MNNFVNDLLNNFDQTDIKNNGINIVQATILSKHTDEKNNKNYCLVNVPNEKFTGILYSDDIVNNYDDYNIGDKIDVSVIKTFVQNNITYRKVSNKIAINNIIKQKALNLKKSKNPIDVKVITKDNQNGSFKYKVQSTEDNDIIGYFYSIKDHKEGDKLSLYIVNIDKYTSEIIFSISKYTSIPLKRGEVVKVNIKNIDYKNYIVSVNIDKFKNDNNLIKKAIIPLTDIYIGSLKDKIEFLNNNQEFDVEVLQIINKNVILSHTKLINRQWKKKVFDLLKKSTNKKIKVKINKIDNDLKILFCKTLEEDIDCVMSFYNLTWSRKELNNILSTIAINDEMEVEIIDTNSLKRCLIVSKKSTTENPFINIINENDLKIEDVIECEVISKSDYIYLDYKGIDCILPKYNITWNTKNSEYEFNKLKVGSKIKVKISFISNKKNIIYVSRKQLLNIDFNSFIEELKYDNYVAIVKGASNNPKKQLFIELIEYIDKNGEKKPIEINSEDKNYCIIPANELVDFNPNEFFNTNSYINKKIKCQKFLISNNNNNILFSEKKYYNFVDKKIEDNMNIDTTNAPTLNIFN